ncbi:hypothetical protein GX865_00645 [Candidatus Saccharibacteria bacterium]|nr:hypothetical protein [Candidatus Saccharibacteria bacterium]
MVRNSARFNNYYKEDQYNSHPLSGRVAALGLAFIALTTMASHQESSKASSDEASDTSPTATATENYQTEQSEIARYSHGMDDEKLPIRFDSLESQELADYMNSHPDEVSDIVNRALHELNSQGFVHGSNESGIIQGYPSQEVVLAGASELDDGVCSGSPIVSATKDNRLDRGSITLDITQQDCADSGVADLSNRLTLIFRDKESRRSSSVPLMDALYDIADNPGERFDVVGITAAGHGGDNLSVKFEGREFSARENGNILQVDSVESARRSIDLTTQRASDISREM